MSRASGLGFGGVLIGLGVGWVAVNYLDVSFDIVAYLLIIAGVGIVASSVLFKGQNTAIGELIGGVIGGLFLAVLFSGVFNFGNPFQFGRSISGSGDLVTQSFDFQGFSAIDASYGFSLEVTQGNEYSISVSVDDNIVDRLDVRKDGDTLKIGLKSGSYSNLNHEARITMPSLSSLEFSGGAHGDISGFISKNDFNLGLSGGSWVTMVGSSGDLKIDASGGSRMFLSKFIADNVDVALSGGSNGSVYARGRLDADVSGGSHLDYYGDPELGKIDTSSGSSITPK